MYALVKPLHTGCVMNKLQPQHEFSDGNEIDKRNVLTGHKVLGKTPSSNVGIGRESFTSSWKSWNCTTVSFGCILGCLVGLFEAFSQKLEPHLRRRNCSYRTSPTDQTALETQMMSLSAAVVLLCEMGHGVHLAQTQQWHCDCSQSEDS